MQKRLIEEPSLPRSWVTCTYFQSEPIKYLV